MNWVALPGTPETLGRYMVYSRHGIEVALYYPPDIWVTPSGCPVQPTHWAPLPDAPSDPQETR